jgi:hypothetical protein
MLEGLFLVKGDAASGQQAGVGVPPQTTVGEIAIIFFIKVWLTRDGDIVQW